MLTVGLGRVVMPGKQFTRVSVEIGDFEFYATFPNKDIEIPSDKSKRAILREGAVPIVVQKVIDEHTLSRIVVPEQVAERVLNALRGPDIVLLYRSSF